MSLPILSSSFFEKHRPTAVLFQQWQHSAPWSESFMPVYEWAGVLYVACSKEPSINIQTDKKVVFVFCEPEVLKSLWGEFNESPEGLSATSHIPSAAPQSASFDDLQLGHSSEEASPSDLFSEISTENSEEPALDLNLSPDLDVPHSVTSAVSLEKTTVTPLASLEESTPINDEPEEPQEEAVPIVASNESLEHTKTIAGYTKITSSNSTQDQVFDGILAEMEKNFPKCMLLIAEGEKDHEKLKPFKWNESFSKANPQSKATPIPLNLPSPFRVIFRTQKSYHGYIVPNDQNDHFFAEWNESQNPDHLTLSPILVDDVVVGAILGLGDKTADNKATLLQTEHLCEAVAKKFRSQPQLMKAS